MSGSTALAKRLLDVTVATVALALLSPLLLMVGLAVVLDSRGPVFYLGQRIGQWGKPFRMVKFRTMCMNADRMGSAVTAGCDPRVTRVGRVLRQWKLDEMPQLVNVLRGEMSLVGPRPESPCYVEHYTAEQRRVLDVRPGITGATQIAYRHEEKLLQNCADLETEYITRIMPQKLAMDLQYIAECSTWLDIRLLARTFLVIFEDDQAEYARPAQEPLPATMPAADGRGRD
jgi:lipopolysaccharide/colanic/teichoic acid biosynthesis glycosyltransferase